jgi:tetraacyldisaccharide 4'-kinase
MIIRNRLYDKGLLKSYSFPLPIITVGNLNTGGTGKTPHIEYLLGKIIAMDKKVAVLSRGYGRNSRGFLEVDVTSDPEITGDEPLQLKQKFSAAGVFVSENRVKGVKMLLKKYPQTDVILLDDAMQHRAIKAGLTILLTNYNDLFVDDYVLPAGNLREPKSGSKRSDIIIVTKCPDHFNLISEENIVNKIGLNVPILFSKTAYASLVSLNNAPPISLDKIGKHELLLITGIADASNILEFLNNKSEKIHHIAFADHHQYCEKDLNEIKSKFNNFAKSNMILVTTEKDAVKLRTEKFKSLINSLPFYYLPIEVLFETVHAKKINGLIYEYVGKNFSNS